MRKLAILTFQTLDGVMQAPKLPEEDFSGGFTGGGWAEECWDEVMEQVGRHAMAETYDLLLGGATYDTFASHHGATSNDNPASVMLSKAKKYAVTSRGAPLEWLNSEKISGDIAAEIARLKAQDGPLLQVHGSWQLIQLLQKHGLIDEYRIWTFPVVVGGGKRLFDDGAVPKSLKLTKFETCPSGAYLTFYEPG